MNAILKCPFSNCSSNVNDANIYTKYFLTFAVSIFECCLIFFYFFFVYVRFGVVDDERLGYKCLNKNKTKTVYLRSV